MKRISLIILMVLVSQVVVFSQGCLPEGITFTTQQQIDDFQTNYPGCTEIEGDVTLQYSDITNLNGLNVITSINGYLDVLCCTSLADFTGLENLTYIGNSLHIVYNDALTTLSGLESLEYIGGYLLISGHDELLNLNGLESLTIVGSDLIIQENPLLQNFYGFSNLENVGNLFWIDENESITNFEGFESLTKIGGDIKIEQNDQLVSLFGIENVEPDSINNLYIYFNYALQECDIYSICQYLASSTNYIEIHNNAAGCHSQTEVEEACASCLPEGITFTTQQQIDDFQTNYPGCTEIEGDVNIGSYPPNNSITNLDSLCEITRINGWLWITYNNLLSDFSGLNSLEYCNDLQMAQNNSVINFEGFNSLDSISWYFSIANFDSLETVSGFNNLDYVGDNIFINNNENLVEITGFSSLSSAGPFYLNNNNSLTNISGFSSLSSLSCLYISNNNSLTGLSGFGQLDSINNELLIYQNNNISDLNGLQNLSFIGTKLDIRGNPQIVSLSGIDSVDLSSIYGLRIEDNSSLSECAITSICDLLDGSTASIEIENNAAGCNNQQEVEEACQAFTEDISAKENNITIFPNPAKKNNYHI